MKTTPTDLDREAGRLFLVGGGARHWSDWAPAIDGGIWSVFDPARGHVPHHPDALDTDDPATVGVMLAQVEEAYAPQLAAARYVENLHIVVTSRWKDCRRECWRVTCDGGALGALGEGSTRSAALVAAMRALK